MKNLLIVIFGTIGVLTASSMSRLYSHGDFGIEVDTSSNVALLGVEYSLNHQTKCSLKHLADSFYVINYSPEKHGFSNARITVTDDTTLHGYTWFSIYAPKLKKTYYVTPISQINTWNSHFGINELNDGSWSRLFLPSQANNNIIKGFNFRLPYSIENPSYCNQLFLRYFLPEPINLLEGNKRVTIELPCLTDKLFCGFSIRENIITITDSTLRWDGISYHYSGFNSLSDRYEHLEKRRSERLRMLNK